MTQPSPGLAYLLEQAGVALADAQQQITALTAECERLAAENAELRKPPPSAPPTAAGTVADPDPSAPVGPARVQQA